MTQRSGDMGFHLERGESAGQGFQRLVRERVEVAVAALRHPGEDPGEAVHCARKQIKKLRALLRLGRAALGDERYERENDKLRELGRSLGAARDADVMARTFDGLVKKGAADEPGVAAIRQRLEARRDAATPRAGGGAATRLEQAARGLEAFGRRARRWPTEGITLDLLLRGLKRSYRRGRKAMRKTEADPGDPERFHDWRKRVKDLWYHARVLGDAWPRRNRKRIRKLDKLADLLGDHHDLAVFADHLATGRDPTGAAGKLIEAAAKRRKKIERKALRLGERVFNRRPRAFTRRLARGWEDAA